MLDPNKARVISRLCKDHFQREIQEKYLEKARTMSWGFGAMIKIRSANGAQNATIVQPKK